MKSNGIIKRVKSFFATLDVGVSSGTGNPVSDSVAITNQLVQFLIDLSNFSNIREEDIYEQLYLWEPEIGGSIDRMSTMVGESFKYFTIMDYDQNETPLAKEMIREAKKLSDSLNIRDSFEMFSEILLMHGNLFVELQDNYSMSILPNKKVTVVDNASRIGNVSTNINDVMMKEEKLIIDEGESTQVVYPKEKFVHIKYKSTPTFYKDSKGRQTFGIYAASPLHRVILPIWWKRQTQIIDVLWRWKNVPREHHKIDAEMFNLNNYVGDLDTRRKAAQADALTFLEAYAEKLNDQVPDQGYATLSTVNIENLQPGNSNYMQTNDLIGQINEQIWSALNMPKSMIAGESHSSYASELVISNYVAHKVVQLASRIKPLILDNMRKRLLTINSNFPIEELDVKLELDIAASRLELFRQAAIMSQMGIFTETEIREMMGWQALDESQRKYLVGKDMGNATSVPSGSGQNYPETPQSETQHSTDTGKAVTNKMENINKG